MAENEILDLGGSRWTRTRAAMAAPDLSLTDVAECVSEDLCSSLRLQLGHALKQGKTLHSILRAAGEHPAALRAAVENFRGQGLARIARDAVKVAHSSDPAIVARCAASMLISACIDRALRQSGRYDRFQMPQEREALGKNLHQRFEASRSEIVAVMEASLRGEAVQRRRRTKSENDPTKVVAQSLVVRSLVARPIGAGHAPQ